MGFKIIPMGFILEVARTPFPSRCQFSQQFQVQFPCKDFIRFAGSTTTPHQMVLLSFLLPLSKRPIFLPFPFSFVRFPRYSLPDSFSQSSSLRVFWFGQLVSLSQLFAKILKWKLKQYCMRQLCFDQTFISTSVTFPISCKASQWCHPCCLLDCMCWWCHWKFAYPKRIWPFWNQECLCLPHWWPLWTCQWKGASI